MWFILSLLPGTIWTVLGYFILFSSTKTERAGVATFGKVLAIWVLVIAALFPITGAYLTSVGFSPLRGVMERMESMHADGGPRK